ncbi:saccharopine dehydrogenase [Nesterenkonia salmonea]|uniref:Saccharopine dehydrogenase n=1 Tax=Nesterenkonia salmonea TaxID=1804987 RepID=A0A5R9BDI0_9MICC|nr:saccharopine dehydrogenase [Nesterenkonia salmonea]TLP98638.1 saccharopine dehydrogenase [Nesterenkonia salmonea]
MKVLVIGAQGAVGATVVSTLRGWGHQVTPACRRQAHDGGVILDLTASDLRPLATAANRHDVIINASGVENQFLARAIGEAVLIDISASGAYLAGLVENAPNAAIVLGAGLAPGLSTVLASELRSSVGDAIDVAVMLGSGEKHGRAAIAWTAGLIGSEITDSVDEGVVYNFREHRWFTGTSGKRHLYLRAGFPDQTLIGQRRGLHIRSWLTLSDQTATRALSLISRLPQLRGLVSKVPAIGNQDWAVTVINRRTGETRQVTGTGQSEATGHITALAVVTAMNNPPRHPVTLDAILGSADLARLPGIAIPPL